MPYIDTMGVTDEMVAIRATTDYFLLVPGDQEVVSGLHGKFLFSDLFTLIDPDRNFPASGITPGCVVRLGFGSSSGTSQGTPKRDYVAMVVDRTDVDPTKLVLRRKGLGSGQGVPPSPIGGATDVSYLCQTVLPQIKDAARVVALRYAVTSESELRTADDFANVVIWEVLSLLYYATYRATTNSVFEGKYKKAEIETAMIYKNLDYRYQEETTETDSRLSIVRIPGRNSSRSAYSCDEV